MSTLTLEEFNRMTHAQMPLVEMLGFVVEKVDHDECVVRAIYKEDFLRPGGTVSGPIMMALADYAMWGAIMARSEGVRMAVTSNLNIHFLIRPEPYDIVAVARVIKFGRRLAVGTVELFGNQQSDLVAHVTCSYSLPPPDNA